MGDTAANAGGRPTGTKGLEGVVAASTSLGNVQGGEGKLYYRGYSIQDLAARSSFEEVMALLWDGDLPTSAQLDDLKSALVSQRALPARTMRLLRELSPRAVPIAALRTIVSSLEAEDEEPDLLDAESLRAKGLGLAARMTTIVAAQARLRQGLEPVDPDPSLDHAANFLYMLHGERATDLQARAFDTYLVLLAEHSLNASTFTARITASTGSDLYAAITAALAALKGDAHGGANQRAMEMFHEIGSPENVPAFIDNAVATRRRLMGIGHRIYRVTDPRAPILEDLVERLMGEGGETRWAEIARRVEQATGEHSFFTERKLSPNVEFYSAPLLNLVGIPNDLFPAVFGCSRIVGWVAHIMEQLADNRLIRPQAEYIGHEPRPYVALEQRG